MLSLKEKQSITIYKNYASKYLNSYKYLADYWVPDFLQEDCLKIENNCYDDLEVYLNNLSLYYKHIKKYYILRQKHYNTFIKGIKTEDEGHKHWRNALKMVVDDAKEKLDKWKNVRNNTFDHLTENYSISKLPDLSIVNVDHLLEESLEGNLYNNNSDNNNSDNKVSININNREINMRKILLQKRLNIEALEEAIIIRQNYNTYITSLKMKKINISDYYSVVDKKHFFYLIFYKYYFEPHEFLVGTDEELKILFKDTLLNGKNEQFEKPFILMRDTRILKLCLIRILTSFNLLSIIDNRSYAKKSKLYEFLREMFMIFSANKEYFYYMIENLEIIGIPVKLRKQSLIDKIKLMFNIVYPYLKMTVYVDMINVLYEYTEIYINKNPDRLKLLKYIIDYISESQPAIFDKKTYSIGSNTTGAPTNALLNISDITWVNFIYETHYDLFDPDSQYGNIKIQISKLIEEIKKFNIE